MSDVNRQESNAVSAQDIEHLRRSIRRLYDDPQLLQRLARNARAFAVSQGNQEREMQVFVTTLIERIGQNRPVLADSLAGNSSDP